MTTELIGRRLVVLGSLGSLGVAACGGAVNTGTGEGTDSGAGGTDSGAGGGRDSGTPVTPDAGPADTAVACTPVGSLVGSVDQFAVGSITVNRSRRVVVVRDDMGIAVFSALCTHEGCLVTAQSAAMQLYCACHGSYFDNSGAVLRGPARSGGPLDHYAASVCDGMLYVDTSQTVSPDTRTAV